MTDIVEQVDTNELVQLCAVNSNLFAKHFFPKTARQDPAPFHGDMWNSLESGHRLVNLQVMRDGAKTTFLRMFTAKRIGYGVSHTILYIGKSEGHAARSIKWLKRQVEYNRTYAGTFNLTKGKKWQDIEAEIVHGTDEYPIWIMGMGITGSIRGINQDDFRPDLIVIDDVMDEENTATPEQREKISNLIYGAIKQSLAPASEAPAAMIAMLQTPLNREDASTVALSDPEWHSKVYGCWTEETKDLELNKQESSWPIRYPSTVVRKEKEAAIRRNKLSLWNREKECKLTSVETSAFLENWLQFYDLAPEHMTIIMAIDPVPPPSDIQIAKGMKDKDYEAFSVVGRYQGKFYLLETSANRGHEPDWTLMEFFRLGLKWRPRKVIVETTAYQKTLEWLLKQAMRSRRQYFVIKGHDDKRSKFNRIVDSLSGVASEQMLYVRNSHTTFIQQFREYPDVTHEDVLEATAVAIAELQGLLGIDDNNDYYDDIIDQEKAIPDLTYERGAP